jgi:hypothetical protein
MIPLSNLKTSVIIAGTSLAIGAVSAWWVTADYKENKYQAILAKIQLDAQKALNDAKDKALAVERENNRIAQELEVQNAKHKQELAKLEDELRGYVNELGGLYDRYATCSDTSMPANAGTTPQPTPAPTGAKLSKQLERLLLSESKRADEAAAYAQTCYQWIQKLRDANK